MNARAGELVCCRRIAPRYCRPARALESLTTLNLDRSECVEVVVEPRKQIALEFKLRGRFGKLSFANVRASIGPIARHGFAIVKLLRRRVALLDPLPDKPAEPVVARGAIRVILPDVQNKFVISHLNRSAHRSPLLHRDVESDVQCLF